MIAVEVAIGLATLALVMLGAFLKIEARQDEKIQEINLRIAAQSQAFNAKIEAQHHLIRDRLDQIWQHINKRPES